MNRKTIIAVTTLAIASLTSCSAQQRQMFNNVTEDKAPAEVVVSLIGDPPVQGPCAPGENVINGVCLPSGTDTPPPTQPAEDPNAPLSCPPGEVVDVDPAPHCILD